MTRTIYVRVSRAQATKILQQLPRFAKGDGPGTRSMSQALLVRIGLAALSRIKQAFIEKSRGGTDETGDRWRPLRPTTIAYNRRHAGVPYAGKNRSEGEIGDVPGPNRRAAYAPSWMLTKAQRARWWTLYQRFGGMLPKGRDYHSYSSQRGRTSMDSTAAAKAWLILKSEGARTLLDTYGNEKVDILRDTGLLLNSLSPGVEVAEPPPPVPPPAPKHQVFKTPKGEVIVGTNRKHAVSHHEGRGYNPVRRLWPKPSRWTPNWWKDILEQAQFGLIDIAAYMIRRTS